MKKIALIATTTAVLAMAAGAQAGGRGGAELGVAGYGSGVGFVGSIGFPINIPAFDGNGMNTYGEVEMGVGFSDEVSFGGDLSIGLLLNLERGLDIYGSLGPGLGSRRDPSFGLAGEVGMNILINDRYYFIEGGAHPGNGYFTVGLKF